MSSENKYELIDNAEKKRYEFQVDGAVAVAEYIKAKDEIFLTHTEVPDALEGKGIGGALVKAALEDIEQKELRLIPLCPFVATYIKRHPEWKRLVMPGYNVIE